MGKYIILDLGKLPEFRSIPPNEFKQILADYRSDTFKQWHTWLGMIISMLFAMIGHLLYYFFRPAGTSSVLWWLITILAFGTLGTFIEQQVRAHATRRGLREFIEKRNSEKDLELNEPELKLYEHLRRLRVNIAVPRGILSNAICNDRSLQEMARSMPTNIGDLNKILGLTDEFRRSYGKIFVDEISMYREK